MTERGVLILHAYSAENAGDGLLVRETVDLVREALGDVPITLIASHPETFNDLAVSALPALPTLKGWDRRTRVALKNIDDFDLVIAVGGGYLRAGTPLEAAKTLLVHGPQVAAASRASTPTIYLPQSIGPARFGVRRWLRARLRTIDTVMVRDDRSLREFDGPSLTRVPDLATAAVTTGRRPSATVSDVPVVSIRAVRGKVSPHVYELTGLLPVYDGYIQSTVSGNDDRPASATLAPRRVLNRSEMMATGGDTRVVVAVRLHAALMALAAGHYVVHLSYERKGFGAFDDLQLNPWVHNVNNFDARVVAEQVEALLNDPGERARYDGLVEDARGRIEAARRTIVVQLRRAKHEKGAAAR